MDLLPASSLLSPLSRVLIHTETQFHLTEPIFLPALIYGPDHDLGEGKGGGREGGREARGASGKGREWRWEQLGGPHPLPADWAKQSGSHHHGKSPVGALFSAGAAKHRGLCSTTITATRKGQRAGPVGFISCPKSQEALTKKWGERMWVS